MILFGIFCIIVVCIVYPSFIIVFLSPIIIFGGVIFGYALKNKIKYGYWMPWEHREELKKKGIDYP